MKSLPKFVNLGSILIVVGVVMILLAMLLAMFIPWSAHKDWDRFTKAYGRVRATPDYPSVYRQMSAQRRMLQNLYLGFAGLICLGVGLGHLSRAALRDAGPSAVSGPAVAMGPDPAQQSGATTPAGAVLTSAHASGGRIPPGSRRVPVDLNSPQPQAQQAAAPPAPAAQPAQPDLSALSVPQPATPAAVQEPPKPAPAPVVEAPPAPAKPPAPEAPKPSGPKRSWPTPPPKKKEEASAESSAPAPAPAETEAPLPRDEMDF